MLFNYTVVGEQGTQQKGKIEAVSEDDAKKKLNGMGLTVLTLDSEEKEEERGTEKSHLKHFLFSGKDIDGQEVEGTIEAEGELSAYQRLVEEFGVVVHWIILEGLPKAVQEAKKKNSVKNIETLIYERGIKIKKPKVKNESKVSDFYLDPKFIEKQKFLQGNIEKIIKVANQLLKNSLTTALPGTAASIEQKLNNLEKIKMSNNLIFVEESVNELVQDIVFTFEKFPKEKNDYKNELLHLESLRSDATQAKVQKVVHDVYDKAQTSYQSLLETLDLKKENQNIDEHKVVLNKLKLERREILRLIVMHFFGFVTKVGELKKKHKEALIRLVKQLKKLTRIILQIKTALRKVQEFHKEFHKRDFSFIIEEIKYFSSWLLAVYVVFFSLAGIAIIKSKILPLDFIWEIFQSSFIITIVFFFFLVLLFSGAIKERFSRNTLGIIASYFGLVFFSMLFYFNY